MTETPSNQSHLSVTSDLSLPSTTTSLLNQVPRFRLLVVGKAGVGKSTLINKAFGLNDESMTSHNKAGSCNINQELCPPSNDRLVVHDSQGFDAGEQDNLHLLEQFIQERTTTNDLSQRLHCVWLCIQVPYGGGRVLETGTEKVLRILANSKIQLPLVVVFTKYDQLVDVKCSDVLDNDPENLEFETEARRLATEEVENTFKRTILDHMKKLGIRGEVVAASTKKDYPESLDKLVKETIGTIEKLSPTETEDYDSCSASISIQTEQSDLGVTDPSILAGIAQRVDHETTIRTIIKIGRKRYWRGMASSTNFPGFSLKKCLQALHADIVKPWNFAHSDQQFLLEDSFQILITEMVDDKDQLLHQHLAQLRSVTSSAGAIAGVAGAAVAAAVTTGPAAIAVGPAIFGALVFAKWVYDVYRETPETLRRLMEYIIHLTNVLLIKAYSHEEGCEYMAKAVKDYSESDVAKDMKKKIGHFARDGGWKFTKRDLVLQKLVALIGESQTALSRTFGRTHT